MIHKSFENVFAIHYATYFISLGLGRFTTLNLYHDQERKLGFQLYIRDPHLLVFSTVQISTTSLRDYHALLTEV